MTFNQFTHPSPIVSSFYPGDSSQEGRPWAPARGDQTKTKQMEAVGWRLGNEHIDKGGENGETLAGSSGSAVDREGMFARILWD